MKFGELTCTLKYFIYFPQSEPIRRITGAYSLLRHLVTGARMIYFTLLGQPRPTTPASTLIVAKKTLATTRTTLESLKDSTSHTLDAFN